MVELFYLATERERATGGRVRAQVECDGLRTISHEGVIGEQDEICAHREIFPAVPRTYTAKGTYTLAVQTPPAPAYPDPGFQCSRWIIELLPGVGGICLLQHARATPLGATLKLGSPP